MRKGLLVFAAALVTLAPMTASAAVRRVVVVGRPFFHDPFWGPYWGGYWGGPYYSGFYGYPNAGEVKLETKVKDAQVFINGSFAGDTHHNKTMYLRPGSYNIEIKEAGRTQFAERVYVTAGKTLKLYPEL
jgi:hypothetical protein